MVRAMEIATNEKAYWCESCEEWQYEHYSYEVVNVDNCSYWDWNGGSYYEKDEVYNHTLYFCQGCDEPVSLDEAPRKQKMGAWVCGECKSRYSDQESARDCCS